MLEKLAAVKSRYEELCARSEQPDFYADPKRAARLLREKNDLEPIVDAFQAYRQAEQDMLDALKGGRIRAVLDVYHQEPLPADHPLVGMRNVILFPHQCGPTYDRRDRITGFLIDDMERFFRGEAVENEITKEVAMRMTK